ncbi:AAA family ATPase [Aliiroseovarius subalbicans]|uniref:AAA family ATPase n=1 Tax=Aliiroseovarius subalbicans TaxID=2925840 RepID=UPI001F577A93|nr:AAA family ATPase [Aliiroseovarius subalbicans]MCI2399089.1 AAA family ATPase [Aliiroseovarius subalbicans]
MIESIFLANEGAYDATGTKLEGLKKLNYIFGSNGSGKTTISRVVEGSGSFPDCEISWTGGTALEARVYNKDFVEKHFDAESSIKGIYTFGENVKVATRIKTLKGEADTIDAKLRNLRKVLIGEDGESGKKKERETLDTQLLLDVWDAKGNFSELKDAFSGLNSDKKKFRDRYLIEASSNIATLKEIVELRKDAEIVFSGTLRTATALPDQDSSKIQALEGDAILKKKIIGKKDVDIAALIETLGNSDWVQQGRQYFDQLKGQCPFCQQKTDAAFKQSLEAYFDETYINDLADIDKLLSDYTDASSGLLIGYNAADVVDSPYLDREAFKKDIAALRLALDSNVEHISAKRKEPSAPAALTDTAPLFAVVNAHIGTANAKVKANNDTIDNLAARKKELTSQIWKRLLEDTKATYDRYMAETGVLDKAITSLSGKIEAETTNLEAKQKEIEENERQITSIKPTIDAINKLLKSFGFTNFHLAEGEDSGFYEVKRADGSDAKRTLSEGEKSFITFLYFFYLVGGSFSSSGGTNDKVVVFDDPVSSLDADILFIVCNLIKNIVAEMRTGTSPIKQVFVLTHNIYFHKEVTFDKKRSAATARSDETFWVVRKTSECSQLVSFNENPIKSSYELLWREVRQKPPSDTAIQNVTRRILEHYFKFYGGITPETIIDSFEGKDKMVCSSLLSWINDGSHFAPDDLYLACDPGQIDRYLAVFQRIFEESGHGGHYKMMMGDDYIPLPLEIAADVEDQDIIVQEADGA